MSKPRGIPSMTGIRGVAAVWVMLFDAQQGAGRIFTTLWRNHSTHGAADGPALVPRMRGFLSPLYTSTSAAMEPRRSDMTSGGGTDSMDYPARRLAAWIFFQLADGAAKQEVLFHQVPRKNAGQDA